MVTLSQTYSKPVQQEQIQGFFQSPRIADKIRVEQNHDQWYIFSSRYFEENQLHAILDDLCDKIQEAQR